LTNAQREGADHADKDGIIKLVRKTLEYDKQINIHRHPVKISYATASSFSRRGRERRAKKLALEHAGGGRRARVADRLRVTPAERRGDGAIAIRSVRSCCTRPSSGSARSAPWPVPVKCCATLLRGRRDIEVAVSDGVVTLEGRVSSNSHKRVAACSRVEPGVRDVVNSLAVEPPEEDNDDEVLDALGSCSRSIADAGLRRSMSVAATTSSRSRVLCVPSRGGQAERDAWYLFAVDRVVNRIEVRLMAPDGFPFRHGRYRVAGRGRAEWRAEYSRGKPGAADRCPLEHDRATPMRITQLTPDEALASLHSCAPGSLQARHGAAIRVRPNASRKRKGSPSRSASCASSFISSR